MPDNSSNRATIRKSHRLELYLTVMGSESTVLEGAVGTGSDNTDVVYVKTAGDIADVERDMEVEFFRSGTSLGRLRVAEGGTLSNTNLPVSEHSDGRIDLQQNDTFKVYREFRLRDKLVASNSTFDKDSRIPYSNQNSAPSPWVNCGGPRVGWVDSGGTATFTHNSNDSLRVDNAGSLSYAWDVRSQAVSGGATNTNTVTVDYDPGQYWISCTATNGSTSASDTKFVPVYAHDDNDAPIRLAQVSLNGSRERGWSATFTLAQENGTLADIPDGAMVIIWKREYYDNTEQSFGADQADASNILFTGWLNTDNDNTQTSFNNGFRYDSELTFAAVGTVQRLQQLPGFSQVLLRESSPSSWQEYEGLTTNAAMTYLLRWGTTAQRVVDLRLPSTNYNYPAFFVDAGTPYAQVQQIADGVDAYISDLRVGELVISHDLNLRDASARSSAVTTITLQARDIVGFNPQRNHTYRVNTVNGEGIIASTTLGGASPVFSRAPDVPGEAPGATTVDSLIVTDQSDLNERTGRRYARENRLHDGLPAAQIDLSLATAYVGIFDFRAEFMQLDLAASHSRRGIVYDDLCWLQAITETYTPQQSSARVTFTTETDGAAGATYIPPSRSDNNVPSFTPPEFDFPSLDYNFGFGNFGQFWLTSGNQKMTAFAQTTDYFDTSNFEVNAPTWNTTTTAIGTIYDFAVDAANPDECWLLTTNGIYKLNISTGAVSSALHTRSGSIAPDEGSIHANVNDPDFVVAAYIYTSGTQIGTYETHTTNGTTWSSEQQIASGFNAGFGGFRPAVQVSKNNPTHVYITAAVGSPFPDITIYRSTNQGTSYSAFASNVGKDDAPSAHLAFGDSSDDLWYAIADNNSLSPTISRGLYRTDTGTGTNYLNGVTDGTFIYTPFSKRGIASNPLDSNVLLLAARTATVASIVNWRTIISSDRGQSWTIIPNPTNINFRSVQIDGDGKYAYALANDDGAVYQALLADLQAGSNAWVLKSSTANFGTVRGIGLMGGGKA